MKVIWTPRAASDLSAAFDYITAHSSDSAIRVADRIYSQVMTLETTPFIGRIGFVRDTRELIFYPWPYIAVYRVTEDAVRILRIRHAAQNWP